jgi:hypothetical protein
MDGEHYVMRGFHNSYYCLNVIMATGQTGKMWLCSKYYRINRENHRKLLPETKTSI